VTDTPHPAAVRAQLSRLLEYERFRNAPKLRRILEFLVEQWLLDVRPKLTERFIGDGLNDEPLTFDKDVGTMGYPKTKTNLHHVQGRLATYYMEPENSMDPVIIKMEKGSYMPIIEFNRGAFPIPELDEVSRRLILRAKTAIDDHTYSGAVRAMEYCLQLVESGPEHCQRWANVILIPFAIAPFVT